MKKTYLLREPDLTAKLAAYPYQEEAFNSVKDLPYAAIFHEQGLGKTKIAIDLILYWLKAKNIDSVVIVTKKQLVENWKNEFNFHTNIRPAILTSNRSSNFFVFNSTARVLITNFEVIELEKERFKLYLKARNVAIIIDESTKIKNPESNLTKTFFELSSLFKIKVIMTGTPVANRPYDIWAQIFFLDQGQSLGKDFNEFKKYTDLKNTLYNNETERNNFEDYVSEIFTKIKNFSVRETKKNNLIKLPDKQYVNIIIDFTNEQKALYEKVRNDMILLINKGDTSILDDSSAAIKKLLRLVQITSNPRLLDDMYFGASAKEKALADLIAEITSKGEKCIVWSIFIENIEYFFNIFCEYNPAKVHGNMSIAERNKALNKFKNQDCRVLFATPQSAKEGLTLTMANHVIFYDRGFSLDDYLQAQDRIHRISQIRTCYVYNIMIKDSIDEWIDLLLKAKQQAAALAQGDITKDEFSYLIDYSFGHVVRKILNID